MSLGICPKCGNPLKALVSDILGIYVLPDTHMNSLLQLFTGETDYLRCGACQFQLTTDLAVIVECTDPPATLIASNSRDPGVLQAAANFKQGLGYSAIERFDSLDGLRSAVGQRLIARVPLLNDLFEAVANDTIPNFLTTRWRQITPFLLNAGQLLAGQLLTLPLFKGTKLAYAVRANTDEIVTESARRLGIVQTMSWVALCEYWGSAKVTGESFESDLSLYICSNVLLPNAVDDFLRIVSSEALPSKKEDPIARYCREAVTASICDAAKVENTRRSQWVSAFFDFEITLQCATDSDTLLDQLNARRISADRAHSTISFQDAYRNIAARLNPNDTAWTQTLRAVADRCGYENLYNYASTTGVRARVEGPLSEGASVADIVTVLREVAFNSEQSDQLIYFFEDFLRILVSEARVDDLLELAKELTSLVAGSDSAKAQIYAKFGACFKELRAPQHFLALIGSKKELWEETLTSTDRAPLWNERANALRLSGQTDAALWWANELLQVDGESLAPDFLRVALLNRAILLRETGAPDLAYAELAKLADSTENPHESISIQISLGVTLIALGQYKVARVSLRNALDRAVPPWDSRAQHIRAMLAVSSALIGDVDGAIHTIEGYLNCRELATNDVWQNATSQAEDDYNSIVLATGMAMVAEVADRQHIALSPAYGAIVSNLHSIRLRAQARGDVPLVLDAFRLGASLAEEGEYQDAWEACYDAYKRYGKPQVADVLVALAHSAYARGAVHEAREKLLTVPEALANGFGGADDLGMTALAPRRLKPKLNALLRLVRTRDDPTLYYEDIRLIAELKRNAVTHAMQRRKADIHSEVHGTLFSQIEHALSHFAASTGPVAVLEWIDDGESTTHLLTSTTKGGTICSTMLEAPDLDETEVSRHLQERLSNWRPSRKGDPFDIDGWRMLEGWLNAALAKVIGAEHHIVIIDNRASHSLPWHVALAPSWSVSYASSWTELIQLSSTNFKPTTRSIGVALVPRFRESQAIIGAFEESIKRTQVYAVANDLEFRSRTGVECDTEGFTDLLANCTIAKLLCHGYINREMGEVALMLSHEGTLPLAHSVAASADGVKGYRMSWRACQALVAVPPVLFSIACSSGLSHTVGLGDRLGLLNAFRRGGAQTLVAPQWDVDVPAVLPILDAALEKYLQGNHTLAAAVRQSCATMATSHPPWISWALAVEGDWR